MAAARKVRRIQSVFKCREGDGFPGEDKCVGRQFQKVIDAQAKDGYELEGWQFQSVSHPDPEHREVGMIFEAIMAVFVKKSGR